MSLETLVLRTQEKFPGCDRDSVRITPLEKGGSERKYYRISRGGEAPIILVKYSSQKEENRHYVDIAIFLAAAGVNVPAIYFHDANEGLIWMQDLGEQDLWAWRAADWEIRRPLYQGALDEAVKLHTGASQRLEGSGLRLEREFNEQLYLWEQGYFFENCLQAHFGVDAKTVENLAQSAAMREIAARLAELPRTLVHRDFQSQNVLIRSGRAWLIDFQGMRPGLPQYDVASLLYDPYVGMQDGERAQLLNYYKAAARGAGLAVEPSFDEVFHLSALQRLMQALGAYGFLGLHRGRADFLSHIPAARRSLREVISQIDGLDELAALLDSLP